MGAGCPMAGVVFQIRFTKGMHCKVTAELLSYLFASNEFLQEWMVDIKTSVKDSNLDSPLMRSSYGAEEALYSLHVVGISEKVVGTNIAACHVS